MALVAVCVLAGCGGGESGAEHNGDASVLVGAPGAGDDMAGVGYGGTVAMVGTCLGINQTTVVWPHGTKVVLQEPLTIDVPGLGVVRVGDRVAGGADAYVHRLPKGIHSLPAGCPSKDVVAFYPGR